MIVVSFFKRLTNKFDIYIAEGSLLRHSNLIIIEIKKVQIKRGDSSHNPQANKKKKNQNIKNKIKA